MFLKSVPGISLLTHKGYLSGGLSGGLDQGVLSRGFMSGDLCPDTGL